MKKTITLTGFASSGRVLLNGVELDPAPSQKVRNHSPNGFAWGYHGSGPAQLALAICLKEIGKACNYQKFKADHIAGIPQSEDFNVQISFDPDEYLVGDRVEPAAMPEGEEQQLSSLGSVGDIAKDYQARLKEDQVMLNHRIQIVEDYLQDMDTLSNGAARDLWNRTAEEIRTALQN